MLPLALAHFLVLGKISKWGDWFQGRDLNPAPAGTLIIFMVGTVVILLRIVDGMVRRADAPKIFGCQSKKVL